MDKGSMDHETFRQQIEEALAHLRDIVALRTMALGDLLTPGVAHDRRGWELSRTLLEAIDELRPGDSGATADDIWVERRYRILTLRYVSGLQPEAVADRLSISRRHFYRQLQRALDEFADYLWASVGEATGPSPPPMEQGIAEGDPLRREGAKQLQSARQASLADVVAATHAVLARLLERNAIAWECVLAPQADSVAMSPAILKQLLLELLGPLLGQGAVGRIRILSTARDAQVELLLETHGRGPLFASHEELSDKPAVRLAAMQGARVAVESKPQGLRFSMRLPIHVAPTVLIVDDNEDVCLLFRRYLSHAGYRVLTATTGTVALSLAREQRPFAVTLDLMMNQEDGWDVLQQLTHDPLTAAVPIVVCSVLDQQELALMLGATAFLKKPVMAEDLLQTLDRLAQQTSSP
jgi:CheY-like chemotaxis protein